MTSSGASADIAARFSDYYLRQIAWLREAVAALDAILATAAEPDYDRWSAEDAARARRLDDLIAEHSALKKEWNAARDLPAAEREAVGALARQAHALRAEFDDRRASVSPRLAEALHAMRGEAGDLRRGRENARKYGTDSESGGAIVDRRA